MKNVKSILKWIPEIYLICSVIYYWIGTWNLFNPIAIGFILILVAQFYFKNKVMGIIISTLFILSNAYMFLALLSEFHEFVTFDNAAKNLLMVGSIYIFTNLAVGIMMFIKYIKSTKPSEVQISV